MQRHFSAFLLGLLGASRGMACLMTILMFCLVTDAKASSHLMIENERKVLADDKSDLSRAMASVRGKATEAKDPVIKRSTFPEDNPHVCLAFLSCCQRIDLLNHTIAGAIRHMEEDEPSYLRYEIAWVDNGSSTDRTDQIRSSYQIDHALTMQYNMGLAYGMNLLMRNMCRAPYILLLEEDWLYLDDLVAPQTLERKRAIATSIALLENMKRNNITAYDGRNVIGIFLRHETYESFLSFPHADIWERCEGVDVPVELPTSESCRADYESLGSEIVNIDYRIFCADTGLKSNSIWGSYTNGAGLYRREDLMRVGRLFGEPGDSFHDRYVEGNFAFRVALRHCHAALRLTPDETCISIHDPECSGAFHHIGGGRGTRPRTGEETICEDPGWNFFATPLYRKYQKLRASTMGSAFSTCTLKELKELEHRHFRDRDSVAYREQVRTENEEVFRREAEERHNLREQAQLVIEMVASNPELLRRTVPWMEGMSDNEIVEKAHRMERLADSPHPLNGFWDSLGRVLNTE